MNAIGTVSGQPISPQAGKAVARPSGAGAWRQPEPIDKLLRGPARFGGFFILLFFGVFGTWAALAPLSSGTIASGVVSPDFSLRTVQHEQGGTIAAVHVIEGQTVASGQLLVSLEATQVQAAYDLRRERWLRLEVEGARLAAETIGSPTMILPPEVLAEQDPAFQQFILTQRTLLADNLAQRGQDEELRAQQVSQFDSQRNAVQASIISLQAQAALIEEELADKQSLLEGQLVARTAVLSLEREKARLQGEIAARQAQVAELGQSILGVEIGARQRQVDRRNEVSRASTEINEQIAAVREELASAEDTLAKLQIRSTAAGRVHELRFATAGAVVGPREKIMDIVPTDDALIILANVSPRDIDVVDVGLQAHVSLVPFANRNALPLIGTVTEKAATATQDERGQMPPFFRVRIAISPEELLARDVSMTPGMPADVTIVTGERTMLQYLTSPFLKSLRNAFIYD